MALVLVIGALAVAAGVFAVPVSAVGSSAAEVAKISFKKKLTPGQTNHTIAYYWEPSGSLSLNANYQNRVVSVRERIMYPGGGMTNPIILWRTTVYSDSKMDFTQNNNLLSGAAASTSVWRKNSSNQWYNSTNQMDTYDWVFGKITLNHYYMKDYSNAKNELIIMHEMMHVYGAKDISDDPSSIMYKKTSWTCTGLTPDANKLLNNKYS
ncbi:MAG: hypothetical protein LBJ12_04845, partial [Oscillospiraceae bacterium]|jgi:hypothetical protein|nr:hypothetical protein [Oscillospiraceae bacterium]